MKPVVEEGKLIWKMDDRESKRTSALRCVSKHVWTCCEDFHALVQSDISHIRQIVMLRQNLATSIVIFRLH
jgi:hypothetical protein